MTYDWATLTENINNSKSILLSTHKNPDGDGLGSEISMYYHLKNMGKDVRIVNISNMPPKYNFMDSENIVETYDPDDTWIENVDLVIVFDLGDFRRLLELGESIERNKINIINIDHHHPFDVSKYHLSIVDTDSPATTYMIWKYFQSEGLTENPLEDKIALALYVGLVNDTGSFRYNAVTSETHNMASDLLRTNINPNTVFQNIYENKTFSQIELLSEMIRNIHFDADGKIGYVLISNNLLLKAEASPNDADGFADYIRGINGVEVSFCVTSRDDISKISFRSRGEYTVNDIAGIFGGGGHYFAAGCEINTKDINPSIEKILKLIKEKL